ncbi:oryzin precursor [Pseudovirgaria hyperparasitica]|uniref:Oryzin n=1 Tax=Pseudovirgaria hyperparasitica TaxID=470096 RepID=A0A6A6W6R7_9PEZI|nr:oryzin precursor [Pseudovirgaria hyperparasitica]KAF2758235.1 oryzin precursor [Pseudovirgaria hyperparasitica]
MRFFTLLAAVPAVLAAPIRETRADQEVIPNKWIAKFKSGSDANALSSALASVGQVLGAEPTRTFNIGAFQGFAFEGDNALSQLVANLASIEAIEPDTKVYASALITQNNPPYGLARISHRTPSSNYVYDSSAGEGTFAYIIDTGIRTTHHDFGGRASFGANFAGDNDNSDGNGHGTHVAGTVGSATYGVAKRTSLIAVKVLDASGSGSNSGVLEGIAWAANDMKAKGRTGKAVGNLSLGGVFSQMTNDAAKAAIDQGLFLAIAAGNSGLPTITSSPASEKSACTVGAIDSTDTLASFSNWGALVDILAPGLNVTSTWNGSDDDTNTISGTSMATPHITGLGAYLLTLEGSRTPAALCKRIVDLSTMGAAKGLTLKIGTPNAIAYNGAA